MRRFTINKRTITDDDPCYVIAELGHNHGGSFATARTMIQTAAACGADAVKLQKRTIDLLYTPEMLNAPYENEHSYGKTYGSHRKALEFGAKEYLGCRAVAKTAGVEFFATAFDEAAADFLMMIDVPAFKLASSSVTDHALIRHVGGLRKPIILSTGGANWAEVDAAVDLLTGLGASFALLHCTAAYPVRDISELNLLAIVEMRARYPDVVIGWSGHDPGITMSLVAYAYGARILEKHVTLNRASKGTDHAFSLEPHGLQVLCEDLRKAHRARGDGVKRLFPSEEAPLAKMRRSQTIAGWRVTGHAYVQH